MLASLSRKTIAALAISGAGVMSIPDSSNSCNPSSAFVPRIAATTGLVEPTSRAALITPVATTSDRAIPANRFTKIISTSGSLTMILNACSIRSRSAEPPISRKFAGSAPAHFVISIVAIASPAPFTMHPTRPPSSFT